MKLRLAETFAAGDIAQVLSIISIHAKGIHAGLSTRSVKSSIVSRKLDLDLVGGQLGRCVEEHRHSAINEVDLKHNARALFLLLQ